MSSRAKSSKSGRTFDFSDLSFAYTVLFALSLVLINPWGENFGEIWTAPKFKVVIGLTVLTWAVLLGTLIWGKHLAPVRVGRLWRTATGLWLAFLASSTLTIILSPVTFRSARIANNEMGDGWLYWFCIAALILGNALLLRRFPKLFQAQLYGLLLGGLLSVLAISVQVFDWKLDFTATSGQVFPGANPPQTQSGVPRSWMPIGFTSIRGHMGFIVAALAVLSLVSMARGWVKKRYGWPLYALFAASVYLTATRGVQLAFAVGMIYLLVRFWRVSGGRRVMAIAFAPLLLGGVLLASGITGSGQQRTMPSIRAIVKNPFKFTSARSDLWPLAAKGIEARPLFGWGFNGFGLAWARVNDFDVRWRGKLARDASGPIGVVEVLRSNHSGFVYLGEDGKTHSGLLLTNKAHNIVLDTALSVGIVGALIYAALFGFFLFVTARGAAWGLEAVGVVYLAFGMTWFESAQFSHLTWWALSVGLAFYALPQALAQNNTKPVSGGRTIVIAPGSAAPGD